MGLTLKKTQRFFKEELYIAVTEATHIFAYNKDVHEHNLNNTISLTIFAV